MNLSLFSNGIVVSITLILRRRNIFFLFVLYVFLWNNKDFYLFNFFYINLILSNNKNNIKYNIRRFEFAYRVYWKKRKRDGSEKKKFVKKINYNY